MGENRPRRHHFIPEMLLRNFRNDEGLLWVGDQRRESCYKASSKNVFVKSNLYSSHDYIQGIDSYEYERTLSRIEGNASAAIASIIEQARNGRNPQLDSEDDEHLKEFVFALARRTPESQKRIFASSDREFDEVFESVVTSCLTAGGLDVPERDWFERDLGLLKLKRTMRSNHCANFAAGEHPVLQEQSERFSRETGWGVARICLSKRSFVIGSHGLTIVREGVSWKGSWLPLAHDVAIQMTACPGRGFRLCLDRRNDWIIKSINRATAAQSDVIAGRSESLVRSLTGNLKNAWKSQRCEAKECLT